MVDDFKKVIDTKAAEWLGTDMEKFLRPQTLFGSKFESYLNQKSGNRIETKKNGFHNFLDVSVLIFGEKNMFRQNLEKIKHAEFRRYKFYKKWTGRGGKPGDPKIEKFKKKEGS